jgi:DNA polymerase III alpha subunit
MKQNKFGEMIFTDNDVCDLIMRGHDISSMKNMIVDESVDLDRLQQIVEVMPDLKPELLQDITAEEFHHQQQSHWHMPEHYKNLDIAAHVLGLCNTQAELQRCGQELLLYQERDLFDLLRYLTYLVDVMRENHVIWGVGRGSSVASYVLYKLGVHRIDSLYYDLDPAEFLR